MMLHAVDDETITHGHTGATVNRFCALHTDDVCSELGTQDIGKRQKDVSKTVKNDPSRV